MYSVLHGDLTPDISFFQDSYVADGTKLSVTCSWQSLISLQTAQLTLRQAVQYTTDLQVPFMPGDFLDHPLTAGYVKLVQTIAPFRDLFVEPHLKGSSGW